MGIRLISTDFDGTLFSEFAPVPVPHAVQTLLGGLQRRGVFWVINTGRDLGSLLETMARAEVRVHPDALVLVEREIYVRQEDRFVPLDAWNLACRRDHQEVFDRIAPRLPELFQRLREEHAGTFYEDAFSPLCVIAENLVAADRVYAELVAFAAGVPHLTVVRNDVYIRLSHDGYDKGSALAEIGRRLGIGAEATLAAGDHYNDLPMLRPERAKWLVAPANAIPEVKAQVSAAGGYISSQPQGEGTARGIEAMLERAAAASGAS
ncbi:MAG: HAD family phosphatase [Verrucomicrobiales bacterium]|nr:HAD family phosphatase [Verrucomicrobiales bacterium]